MVEVMNTIASVPTKGAFPEIVAVSNVLSPILEAHGEALFVAGVAHAIGLNRILNAVATPQPAFACEAVRSGGEAHFSRVGKPHAAGQGAVMFYYVAGCEGAKQLGKRIKRNVFKFGYTCLMIPAKRLAGLDAAVYGGWSASQKNPQATAPLPGWDEWQFAHYEERDTAHLLLPQNITIVNGLWRVELPPGVQPESLDRIVTAAMMSRQLGYWATSCSGRLHCLQHGVDPQECIRFARNERTGVLRPVEELYTYSPRRDAAWFAAILIEALAIVAGRVRPY